MNVKVVGCLSVCLSVCQPASFPPLQLASQLASIGASDRFLSKLLQQLLAPPPPTLQATPTNERYIAQSVVAYDGPFVNRQKLNSQGIFNSPALFVSRLYCPTFLHIVSCPGHTPPPLGTRLFCTVPIFLHCAKMLSSGAGDKTTCSSSIQAYTPVQDLFCYHETSIAKLILLC